MILDQFKVIGQTENSTGNWCTLGPRVSLFSTKTADFCLHLFSALQAVNALYDVQRLDPFKHFPQYLQTQQGLRRVVPGKKTAAIAIYSAEAELVHTLAAFTEALYEVDRIEVGIRRDYSRWMNFVELSSSTRWSEVSGSFETLLESIDGSCPQDLLERFSPVLRGIAPTERIKGPLVAQLLDFLTQTRDYLPLDKHELHAILQLEVNHHRQCCLAKEAVYERLPHFIRISVRDTSKMSWYLAQNLSSLDSASQTDTLGLLVSKWIEQQPQVQDHAGIARELNTLSELPIQDRVGQYQWVAMSDPDRLELVVGTGCLGRSSGIDRTVGYLQSLLRVYRSLHGCFPVLLIDPREMFDDEEQGQQLLVFLQKSGTQTLLLADKWLETVARQQFAGAITYIAYQA